MSDDFESGSETSGTPSLSPLKTRSLPERSTSGPGFNVHDMHSSRYDADQNLAPKLLDRSDRNVILRPVLPEDIDMFVSSYSFVGQVDGGMTEDEIDTQLMIFRKLRPRHMMEEPGYREWWDRLEANRKYDRENRNYIEAERKKGNILPAGYGEKDWCLEEKKIRRKQGEDQAGSIRLAEFLEDLMTPCAKSKAEQEARAKLFFSRFKLARLFGKLSTDIGGPSW